MLATLPGLVLDLVGTAVFALSGAAVAVQRRLDVFGTLVLALAAGVGGGVLRDVALGVVPPLALTDPRYGSTCLVATVLAVTARPDGRLGRMLTGGPTRLAVVVQVLDAVGLGLFAVVGTSRALDAGLGPVAAAAMGVVTAVGGGVVRDVLADRTPAVLHRDVYALAAAAGAATVALGEVVDAPAAVTVVVGIAVASGLRLAALQRSWRAPRPRVLGGPGDGEPQ